MIAKTGFAIASEESRYTLNGALMVLKPESITMVATDGHRLSHIERSGERFEGVSGEMKTLVPKKAMDELKSLLDSTDAEVIEFAKQCGFRLHEIRRLLHGAPGERVSARWQTLVRGKLEELKAQQERIAVMQSLLERAGKCQCIDVSECGRNLLARKQAVGYRIPGP